MRSRAVTRLLTVGGCWLAAGCGSSDRAGLQPVKGTLRVNGQPAAAALVTFHPTGADAARPTGRVGGDGTFTLTTRVAGDGAPVGEYRVTVTWAVPVAPKG